MKTVVRDWNDISAITRAVKVICAQENMRRSGLQLMRSASHNRVPLTQWTARVKIIRCMKTIWIVGKALDSGTSSWAFQGAFDSKNLAENYCIDDKYFIGPCILNDPMPAELVEWRGAYYPKGAKSHASSAPAAIVELQGRTRTKRNTEE